MKPSKDYLQCRGCGRIHTTIEINQLQVPMCICGRSLNIWDTFPFFSVEKRLEFKSNEAIDSFVAKANITLPSDEWNDKKESNKAAQFMGMPIIINDKVPEKEAWLVGEKGIIQKYRI